MKPGDYLLCYMTGISRWIGVLEVSGEPFKSTDPIWKDEVFPCRVPVKVVSALKPETAVPVLDMRDRLSVFLGLKNPNLWSGAFRGSPAQWKLADGEAIVAALADAAEHPTIRPVDAKKLARRPVATASDIGLVTIPVETDEELMETPLGEDVAAATAHTEIQALLLKLGAAMGLNVWVAGNDRSRMYKGVALGDMPRMADNYRHSSLHTPRRSSRSSMFCIWTALR